MEAGRQVDLGRSFGKDWCRLIATDYQGYSRTEGGSASGFPYYLDIV